MPTLQEQLNELLAKPLQDADLKKRPLQSILKTVQGNILHGHGRDFAAHIFLQFQIGKETEIKQWLRDHIVGKITSAQDQLAEKQAKNRRALFVSCSLSAEGYHFFGSAAPNPPKQFSVEFLGGMKEATGRLQDPTYTSWEKPYQEEIHAMILLAHQDEKTLLDEQKNMVDNYIQPLTVRHWVEYGHVLRQGGRTAGPRVEHFGYVDGGSQPLFFQRDIEKEERKSRIDQWNPGVGPHLVLTPDPLGGETDYGSYVVFRKLEQDVARFATQIRIFAQAQDIDEEVAMARVVGRFRDGTPLVPSVPPNAKSMVPNNFRYDTDWDGQHCPFTAHIRRMNPRWAPGSLAYDRRIARRGLSYGVPGDKSVGLFFICYQQDLKTQFEALQGEWAQIPAAFAPTGPDSLIGHMPTGEKSAAPKRWAIPGQVTAPSMGNCVTLKGGEYFFVPSKHVLKDILTRL